MALWLERKIWARGGVGLVNNYSILPLRLEMLQRLPGPQQYQINLVSTDVDKRVRKEERK